MLRWWRRQLMRFHEGKDVDSVRGVGRMFADPSFIHGGSMVRPALLSLIIRCVELCKKHEDSRDRVPQQQSCWELAKNLDIVCAWLDVPCLLRL